MRYVSPSNSGQSVTIKLNTRRVCIFSPIDIIWCAMVWWFISHHFLVIFESLYVCIIKNRSKVPERDDLTKQFGNKRKDKDNVAMTFKKKSQVYNWLSIFHIIVVVISMTERISLIVSTGYKLTKSQFRFLLKLKDSNQGSMMTFWRVEFIFF